MHFFLNQHIYADKAPSCAHALHSQDRTHARIQRTFDWGFDCLPPSPPSPHLHPWLSAGYLLQEAPQHHRAVSPVNLSACETKCIARWGKKGCSCEKYYQEQACKRVECARAKERQPRHPHVQRQTWPTCAGAESRHVHRGKKSRLGSIGSSRTIKNSSRESAAISWPDWRAPN